MIINHLGAVAADTDAIEQRTFHDRCHRSGLDIDFVEAVAICRHDKTAVGTDNNLSGLHAGYFLCRTYREDLRVRSDACQHHSDRGNQMFHGNGFKK